MITFHLYVHTSHCDSYEEAHSHVPVLRRLVPPSPHIKRSLFRYLLWQGLGGHQHQEPVEARSPPVWHPEGERLPSSLHALFHPANPGQLWLKEALRIHMTPAEEQLDRDTGLEIPGCWMATLRKQVPWNKQCHSWLSVTLADEFCWNNGDSERYV